MTVPHDLARCAGNGDPACDECVRRLPGNPYTSSFEPPPAGRECHLRVVPLDVLLRELQGRGD